VIVGRVGGHEMSKWMKVATAVLIVGACVGIAGAQTEEKWRLAMQTWSFSEFTFVEAVAKTNSVGLKYIEAYPDQRFSVEKPDVKVNPNMTAEQRQEVKQMLKDNGLTLTCYGVITPGSEQEWRKVFDFAKDMDFETIVSEPPESAMEMIDKLCNEYKIGVAIHNHPRPSQYWDPNMVLKVCQGRSRWIGACADTGHWMRSSLDPLKAVQMLGEAGRIRSFHFKDLNKFGVNDYETAHDVPWGAGVGKPKEILTALARLGFEGTFSIEYEYNWYNNVPEIAKCVEWFRKTAVELSGVQADLTPVLLSPDFNGDWRVDINDLVLLIEHWGQDDPSFDIAPPPWGGDGMVDKKDLEVLMRYWGQEIPDPTLVACWKLDEADGVVAVDSVGANDANAVGEPVWQPTGGKIGGALLLDGLDDYVAAPFLCDPAAQPFSVFAWIKGGGPGQVILSQVGGANWLMAGLPDGLLMTDLKSLGRRPKSLISTTVITGGDWHRVGLSWDGSNRVLYIDDIEVARDTQGALPSSQVGLTIGAGSTLAAGTFWAGLIDEVRIYDRAVKP
jgi:sugar phosphate isomerase/epimerase